MNEKDRLSFGWGRLQGNIGERRFENSLGVKNALAKGERGEEEHFTGRLNLRGVTR